MPRKYESPVADKVLQALENAGAMGTSELVKHTGLTRSSVLHAVRGLIKRNLAHIAKYERQPNGKSGSIIPIYQSGECLHVIQIKRKSDKEIQSDYRKRHAARIRVKRQIQRGSYRVNVWSGLMG